MNGEPTLAAALWGALGYVLLQCFAPIAVGVGQVTLSLWLVPLAAIHLWPRQSTIGPNVVLILIIGFLVDLATGLRLGTSPLIALVYFFVLRPDQRDRNLRAVQLWLSFIIGILITVITLIVVLQSWDEWLPLAIDGLVAIFLFPLVYRLLRILRTIGRDREELFP